MQVAFRTDASLQIGTGHVMRCLTLAEALKAEGAQCHFICREHPGNLIDQIRQRGFIVKTLPMIAKEMVSDDSNSTVHSEYASWLGADRETDAAQTKGSIGETVYDWLIVDHYALDEKWEKELRSRCRRLMVIDDLADRPHDCDLVLDQNLGRDKSHYHHLVPESCTVLTGPRYALLRPEFAAFRDYSLQRRVNPELKHLMISMGGIDQINATEQVLEAIKQCALPDDLRMTVVMGPNAPGLSRVKSIAAQLFQPAEVKVNVQNMAQLMADSDLAIGAAGSTSWERCCLGLPTLTLIVAENQRQSAMALERKGCAKLLDCIDIVPKKLSSILSFFMNGAELMRMSRSSSSVVDGKGTGRVLRTLFESAKTRQNS